MKYLSDLGARARWSMLTTTRRVTNRWWDLAGRAAGFCMATTWQQGQATYKPGMKHWRCYVLRSAHAGQHRNGNYRWATGGKPIYDPLPLNVLRSGPKPGVPPRWLRDRHYDIGTRARDRLALQVVFDRIRSSGRDRLARSEGFVQPTVDGIRGHRVDTPDDAALRDALGAGEPVSRADAEHLMGELGIMPFTARVADQDLGGPERARHDFHVHPPRLACGWHLDSGDGPAWDCPACQRANREVRP
jgi:hypothetical protein